MYLTVSDFTIPLVVAGRQGGGYSDMQFHLSIRMYVYVTTVYTMI